MSRCKRDAFAAWRTEQNWSEREESTPPGLAPKASDLPLTHTPMLAPPRGLEPPFPSLGDPAPFQPDTTAIGREGGTRTHGLFVPNEAVLPLTHSPIFWRPRRGSNSPMSDRQSDAFTSWLRGRDVSARCCS